MPPAGFHAINADPNIAALQSYTIGLYKTLQEESGQNVGLHMAGGVNMAGTPERWEWLKSAWAVFQTMGMEEARLMTPEEIKEVCPIADVSGIYGGLYDPNEGPSGRLWRHPRLCHRGEEARRRSDPAQPGAGTAAAPRRQLDRGHRAGNDHRRACGQCRRDCGRSRSG